MTALSGLESVRVIRAAAAAIGLALAVAASPVAAAQETTGKTPSKLPGHMLSKAPEAAPSSSFGDGDTPPPAGTLGTPTDGASPDAGAASPDDAGKDNGVDAADRAYGAFQRGYYLTALNIALPRAELGDPAAQTLVAEIFARGLGVARSMDDAAFWYGQAAKGGDASAQFKYALMLMEGKYVKKDEARAKELMTKAANAGIPAAEFNHAQQLVADQPGERGLKAALPYFERAAEAGISDAQYALSQIYANSAIIPDEKRGKARYWLTRAARAGYDTAQLDLGIWLIDGVAGDKDYEKGFTWMQRAAEGGNVMAQNRLAHLYRAGIGTKQDRVAAASWYVLSRRAGLQDHELDDFYQGLTDEEQKEAISRANEFQRK